MENEVMNYEEEVMENEDEIVETESRDSGISTGVAIAIGAGLAIAVNAVVKLGQKLWANHKAKKELRLVEKDKDIEPTDEQLMEVTK